MERTVETRPPRRRQYTKRSDEDKIRELQKRIEDLKAKRAARERRSDPLIREIPRVQKRLRKFAQMAMDQSRPDIANSTTAFSAALGRILRAELGDEITDDGEPIED